MYIWSVPNSDSMFVYLQALDICTHFMELQDPRMQYFGIFVEDVNDTVCGHALCCCAPLMQPFILFGSARGSHQA